MNPIAHAELAWLACAQPLSVRRDRAIVTLCGVAPDLDGLALVLYPFDGGDAYARWHHLLTHSALAGALAGGAAFALATRGRRGRTALLAVAAFHLHLVCDLLGSGAGWPIFYWYPFKESLVAPFSFGWELGGWQNIAIGIAATLACLAMARAAGRTPLEVISPRGERTLVPIVRRWLGAVE